MSSLSLSPTPADLSITPRDRRFGRDDPQGRWWLNGDPIGSVFHTALSVTFPKGEAMFIEAVKAHRDGVPDKLAREIRAFTQQEVIHSREQFGGEAEQHDPRRHAETEPEQDRKSTRLNSSH